MWQVPGAMTVPDTCIQHSAHNLWKRIRVVNNKNKKFQVAAGKNGAVTVCRTIPYKW
jgi:hypothetical protein